MYGRDYEKPVSVRAQIRSTRGETIDLTVPTACTVGQLCDYLIQEYHYPPETRLMYSSSVLNNDALVEDFPFGSLVISTSGDATRVAQGSQAQQQSLDVCGVKQQQHHHQIPPPRNLRNSCMQTSQQHQYHEHQQQRQESVQRQFQHERDESYVSNLPSSKIYRNQQQYSSRNDNQRSASPPTSSSKATQQSGTPSNSAFLSELITPMDDDARDQLSRGDGVTRSLPRQSTPPKRIPRGIVLNEADINVGSVASRVPTAVSSSSLENELMGEGVGTSQDHSAAATPMRVSRTCREGTDRGKKTTALDETSDVNKKHHVSLRCVSPSLKKNIVLELADDATLGDLLLEVVAQEPRLAGFKVVFRGKILSGCDTKLSSCGIRVGASSASLTPRSSDEKGVYTLFFASSEPDGPQKAMLMEIEADVACIESLLQHKELTMQERRGYYEELMRILFRTDNLQDLEDEWRLKRKEVVKKVTSMQDRLKVGDDR